MKTRRSRKSFEPPPPPRRKNNKRRSLKRGSVVGGRPLKAVNEAVVVLSDSESEVEECVPDIHIPDDHDSDNDIQVVDIADVSDVGRGGGESQELEEGEIPDSDSQSTWRKPEPETGKGENNDNDVLNPLASSSSTAHRTPSPKSSCSKTESPPAAVTKKEEEQPAEADDDPEVIDIGDDESECATQTVVDVDDVDDDDGVEVVAVVITATAQKNQRLSRGSIKRKRSSIGGTGTMGGDRKSNGNFSVMQEAIKKAKNVMRRSSSNNSNRSQVANQNWKGFGNHNHFNYNGISHNSRQISKNKKKKSKKKLGRPWQQQQQQQQGQQGQTWLSRPFHMNRERELNRQVIYRPGSNNNPVEGITVNVNNPPNQNPFPNPCYQPVPGCSRNEMQAPWIPQKRRGPSPIAPGSNIMIAGETAVRPKGSPRPIVIDGSNIAMEHGKQLPSGAPMFSARGIQICVDYFIRRGHKEIVAFVPRYRLKKHECRDTELLEEMEKAGHVKFTPSRDAGNERIASYDDLFVVQYAHETGGVIVSNDQFKDLFLKNEHLRETIRFRILQYTWITPLTLMFAEDPLGRNGPSLDDFLKF